MEGILLLKKVSKYGGGHQFGKDVVRFLAGLIIPNTYHVFRTYPNKNRTKLAIFIELNKEYLVNMLISVHYLKKIRCKKGVNDNVWGMANSIYHHDYEPEIKELVEDIVGHVFLILKNMKMEKDPTGTVSDEIYAKQVAIKLINEFIK